METAVTPKTIDQDTAAEQAARELERRLRTVLPPSLLADAAEFAAAFVRWQFAHDWRCWPRSQVAVEARKPGVPPDAYDAELAAVRARCAEASAHHAAASGR